MNSKSLLPLIIIPLMFLDIAYGQDKSGTPVTPSFDDVLRRDFSQLIGASSPGISVSYNSDKSSLTGSFTAMSSKKHFYWIQVIPTIGTTTTLFDFSQSPPQPDFSLAFSGTILFKSKYYKNVGFNNRFDEIRSGPPLKSVPAGIKYHFSEKLRANLQSIKPKYTRDSTIYTAKNLMWIGLRPEWGGANYNFFDKTLAFKQQLYNPYYNLYAFTASYNYYFWRNNEDLKWHRWLSTRFLYLTVGVRIGTNNNSDVLKKGTVNDVSSSLFDTATGTVRQSVKSTSAYLGQFQSYNGFSPSFEVLYSLVNYFAFDFFGNYNYVLSNKEHVVNNGSIAAGLYFNTSNEGSKVNIGIYYQRSVGSSPVKEIIGLKTKIPINWN